MNIKSTNRSLVPIKKTAAKAAIPSSNVSPSTGSSKTSVTDPELAPQDRFTQNAPIHTKTTQSEQGVENTSDDIVNVKRIDTQVDAQASSALKKGVRLEKQQLLTVLQKSVAQLSETAVEEGVALHQNQNTLAKQILLGKTKTYPTLEKAVEAANQNNKGEELIVAVRGESGVEYAVVELEGDATAAQALATLGPQAEAYLTDKNGVLTPLDVGKESLSGTYKRVSNLADLAVADNARGFDRNRTQGTQVADRTPAYVANLRMATQEIKNAKVNLQQGLDTAQAELKAKIKNGQGDSPDAKALQTKISKLSQNLESLRTSEAVITARLLQLPTNGEQVPGSELDVGAYRSRPRKLVEHLQSRLDQVNTKLMVTRDPAVRKDLEAQRNTLQQEVLGVHKRNDENRMAQLHTDVRLGALATMNKSLAGAHSFLNTQVNRLNTLEAQLPHLEGPDLAKAQSDIKTLRADIDASRKRLIKDMKDSISVYSEHANTKHKGAKDAIKLLEAQITKLEALTPGQEKQLLVTIDNTHELLLESVKNAGSQFVGITRSEAEALANLDTKTDDYVSDYIGAQSKVKALKKEISQKQALYNDPSMQQTLIGDAKLSDLEKAYIEKVQKRIGDAKSGPLLELKKLYSALQMSKNKDLDPKLRERIDIKEIEKKIADLSKQQDVIDAFAAAKKEAVAEVFGKKPVVKELKAHLLSPKFQAYLDLLPENERKAVLQADLAKLAFADPRAAAEVQQALVGRKIQQKSVEMLKSMPTAERASAFAEVMKAVDKPVTGADKTVKVADALAQSLDKLTDAEAQKMNLLIKELQNGKASAQQKLLQMLFKGVDESTPSGKSAINYLKGLGASNKLGGFLALTAVVGAGGKIPADFKNADLATLGQFGAASAGAVGNASALAKMVGFDADSILSDIKKGVGVAANADNAADFAKLARMGRTAKALKVLEVLGPIGDIAGAGFDFYNAAGEFEKGDNFGGSMKVVSGSAGLVGAGASIAILAGASGPAAPVVLVGATLVGLVAWGADELWGESDEETFLRNLGVLKPV